MGLLVNGVWEERWYENGPSGRFVRDQSAFRNWVTPDGSPGPAGDGGFPAARGRYHLYVCLACPWAHRTIIFRKLKKLEDVISMDIVEPVMGEGWDFGPEGGGDHLYGKTHLHEIYTLNDPR